MSLKKSRNYKKKEDYIEYRFSNNIEENKPFLDIKIPFEKTRNIFEKLQEIFGENNEIIKEYSIYKYNDLELTVFPDGSSFCLQVSTKKLEDNKTPKEIIVTHKEKYKISNDYFPCKFSYNSSIDVIDVIFTIKKGINIILSTIYENNKNNNKLTSIEDLGRPLLSNKLENIWCELYVSVECTCDTDDVYKTIDLMKKIVYEK